MPRILKFPNAVRPLHTFVFALAAMCLLAAAPARAGEDPGAEAFVRQVGQEAIQIITNSSYTDKDREAAFRVLFVENADVRRIGLFALGQYVRMPTPEQKAEYLGLVEDFIVKVYVNRLRDYDDQQFEVVSSRAKGNKGTQALVQSRILFTDGRDPIPIEWWLLKDEGRYRIFDIKAAGIWLAQEQRATYASIIRNNNSQFGALLEHLRTQIAETEAENGAAQQASDGATAAN